MVCKKCGNELKNGAKFCYSCGYYIDDEEVSSTAEEKPKKKSFWGRKKDEDDSDDTTEVEHKLTWKEKREKKKEEKLLAKEARIRQKEIEQEQKEMELLEAENAKRAKIDALIAKEEQVVLQNKKNKEKEKDNVEKLLKKERESSFKEQSDRDLEQELIKIKDSKDEPVVARKKVTKQPYYEENANFSYGDKSLYERSPSLGVEEEEEEDDYEAEADKPLKDLPKKVPSSEIKNEYNSTIKRSSKKSQSEFSKYVVVIIAAIMAFLIIFFLVYFITNQSSTSDPQSPPVYQDNLVRLGNCTVTLPGNLNYNVEGNSLYVAYEEGYTLSFNVSKENFDKYANDLSILSKDFTRRNYTVNSADRNNYNGKDYIIYKLTVNGSLKYFYLTKASEGYIAMGMIEFRNQVSIDSACQSITNIVNSIVMY